MHFIHRCVAAMAAAILFAGLSAPARADSVNLGHVNVSFYEATANVIGLMLERSGWNVALKSGSHSNIYPQIANGDVDLFVAAWLPYAHANYWKEYQGNLVQLGPAVRRREAVLGRAGLRARLRGEERRRPEEAGGRREDGQDDPRHAPRQRADDRLEEDRRALRPGGRGLRTRPGHEQGVAGQLQRPHRQGRVVRDAAVATAVSQSRLQAARARRTGAVAGCGRTPPT